MKSEKLIILCCFISVGIYVIIVAARYPSIPNTMSPGFFPTAASILLVCLSIVELLLTLFVYKNPDTGEENAFTQRGALSKIFIVNAMLIAMVLIMRYILPVLGIFMFLFAYLVLVSKQRLKLSVPVSLAGTAAIYLFIWALRIPL